MRGLLAVVAGLAAVVSVTANCPNACSGHGDCSTNHDFCSCYSGFIGADCSERLCPFGLAYIDLPQGDLDHDNALNSGGRDKDATTTAIPAGTTIDGETTGAVVNPQWRGQGWWERHPSQLYGSIEQAAGLPFHVRDNEGHFYAECSSQGICDRSSGLCECFPGYEGGACNRTTCPNDCSGHGVCRTTAETLPAGIAYNLWDAPKYQHCVCDGGFDGLDCSMRVCPRGDDPLTTTTTVVGYNNGIAESGEIQYIDVRCSYGGSMLDANVALVYTDATTGDSYETSWIDPTDTSASNGDAIVAALRALPNDVLAEFVVDGSTVDTYSKVLSASVSEFEENQFYRIAVTFAAAFGDVPMLSARAHENFICKGGLKVDTRYGTKTDVYENIAAYVVGDGPREHLRIEIDIADEASGSVFTYTIADKDGNVYNNADAATHTPTNTTAGTGEMLSGAAAFTREATKIAFHWQFGDGIDGRGDMGADAGLTYLLEYVVDPVISSSHYRFDFNGTAAILTTAPVWTNQTNTTGASDSIVFSAPEDTNPLYDLSIRLVALAGSDVDNETYAIYVNGEFIAYFEGEFPDSVSDGADLFSLIDEDFAAGVPANGKNWIGNVTFSAAGTVYGGDEWNFHLPKLPKVYNATGPDEIGVVFLNDDAVDVTVPLVIKILSVSSNPDMYAWKVAGDAAWTDNNGAGYAIPSITNATALGGAEDYAAANAADPVRSQVANILLEWNSGADFDARICSTATNGAYYYIQIGSDGLNDRPECSGRGVCDYSSGRCQCFTGYSGLACSEQNALARGGFGRVVSV